MNTPSPKQPIKEISHEDDEINFLDILQVTIENLQLLTITPIMAGILAFGICLLIPPTFTANVKFLPPQQQQSAAASMLQSLGALGGLAGAAAGLKNPSDQYIALLKTRSIQDALIRRFKLQQRYNKKYMESTRNELENNSLISTGKDNIITIQLNDKDPKVAADIANAYVEELSLLLNRLAITEAQQRRVFFEKQLADTKIKLNEAEKALTSSGISIATLHTNPLLALEGPARLRAQATAQEIKLATMRSYLTETAPEFRQALNELAALREQLAKTEKGTPEKSVRFSSDYINKYRDYKFQETLLDLFTRQFEIAKVDESREGAVIQVVDAAQPPEYKSKPKKALIAIITALATLAALITFILMRQAFQSSMKNNEKTKKLYNSLTSKFKSSTK